MVGGGEKSKNPGLLWERHRAGKNEKEVRVMLRVSMQRTEGDLQLERKPWGGGALNFMQQAVRRH